MNGSREGAASAAVPEGFRKLDFSPVRSAD